jgi:ATP-binding cassette subfamily F protein 3
VGGWAEYGRVRDERIAAGEDPMGPPPAGRSALPAKAAVAASAEPAPPVAPAADGPSKNALRRQDQLERAVEKAEAELAALEQELADPALWADKYESAKATARHTAAKRAVEAAYAELEAHAEKIGA